MKDVFQFSRGSSKLLLEAAYASGQGDDSFLYSEKELHMIQRSIYTLLGFASVGLWSSGPGESHFFGTGSCLIQLKRPAMEVSLGILHGIFLKQWRNHVYQEGWSECDERYTLRQLLGTELETFLWIESGSGATGPWDTCVDVWQQLVDKQHTSKKIKRFVESTPIAFQLCDEMDEVMGGDSILGANWKRRSKDFYQNMIRLAHSMDLHTLEPQLKAAVDFDNTIYPTSPTQFYKQLHPLNETFLFGTVEVSTNAHPEDIERYRFLNKQGRHDRQLLPLFKDNQMQQSLIDGIGKAQDLCDAAANKTITLDMYIDEMNALKHDMMYCERHDPRFFANSTTIPKQPPKKLPKFAIPPRVPEGVMPKEAAHQKNYDYDPVYEENLLPRLLRERK
ncbi:MAG: hypothetical protein SGILL_008717 [Bacillariaceae sp.]